MYQVRKEDDFGRVRSLTYKSKSFSAQDSRHIFFVPPHPVLKVGPFKAGRIICII